MSDAIVAYHISSDEARRRPREGAVVLAQARQRQLPSRGPRPMCGVDPVAADRRACGVNRVDEHSAGPLGDLNKKEEIDVEF